MSRRSTFIVLAVAGAALAVAGGGAALAASGALSPSKENEAVIEDAAKQLGVEPSELSAALRKALENRIDEAVKQGRLTEEQADALKERIDSAGAPLIFGGLGAHRPGDHFDHFDHFGHFESLDAAATYLGLTEAELRSKLADEKSLADVAKEQGKSVDGLVQALVDAASERIDQAVENGRLTKAQAAEIKDDLEDRITELVNREPRAHGLMPPHGFHDGFGHHFGQFGRAPRFSGPRA
jgi:polyhydroxyalkanoate synthesis regulator phasin